MCVCLCRYIYMWPQWQDLNYSLNLVLFSFCDKHHDQGDLWREHSVWGSQVYDCHGREHGSWQADNKATPPNPPETVPPALNRASFRWTYGAILTPATTTHKGTFGLLPVSPQSVCSNLMSGLFSKVPHSGITWQAVFCVWLNQSLNQVLSFIPAMYISYLFYYYYYCWGLCYFGGVCHDWFIHLQADIHIKNLHACLLLFPVVRVSCWKASGTGECVYGFPFG